MSVCHHWRCYYPYNFIAPHLQKTLASRCALDCMSRILYILIGHEKAHLERFCVMPLRPPPLLPPLSSATAQSDTAGAADRSPRFAVAVRKRPLWESESCAGEFDVLTVLENHDSKRNAGAAPGIAPAVGTGADAAIRIVGGASAAREGYGGGGCVLHDCMLDRQHRTLTM